MRYAWLKVERTRVPTGLNRKFEVTTCLQQGTGSNTFKVWARKQDVHVATWLHLSASLGDRDVFASKVRAQAWVIETCKARNLNLFPSRHEQINNEAFTWTRVFTSAQAWVIDTCSHRKFELATYLTSFCHQQYIRLNQVPTGGDKSHLGMRDVLLKRGYRLNPTIVDTFRAGPRLCSSFYPLKL